MRRGHWRGSGQGISHFWKMSHDCDLKNKVTWQRRLRQAGTHEKHLSVRIVTYHGCQWGAEERNSALVILNYCLDFGFLSVRLYMWFIIIYGSTLIINLGLSHIDGVQYSWPQMPIPKSFYFCPISRHLYFSKDVLWFKKKNDIYTWWKFKCKDI